jgi:hypothetical protein
MMEMELIDRYTYAVTQNLPEKQRADIERELRGLIEDMLEDRLQGREATRQDVEAVLSELGAPSALADKYRGAKRYLIGPEVFPTYLSILKIVAGALGIAMLVLFTIQTIQTPMHAVDHFINTLMTFFSACIQAFAWVTVIFGVLEYTGALKGKIDSVDDWKPSDLPPLPEYERRIGRADPIAGIVFTILFVALVTYAFQLFGVWMPAQGSPTAVIPFLNEPVFRGFLPLIWAAAAAGVLNEAVKLIIGRWTPSLIGLDFLVQVLGFGVGIWIFSHQSIWNSNFMQQIVQAGLIPASGETFQTINTVWVSVTQNFVLFVGLVFVIQVISTVFKFLKMRRDHPGAASKTAEQA